MSHTPFDSLIIKLGTDIYKDPGNINHKKLFILRLLQLLRTTYLLLKRVKIEYVDYEKENRPYLLEATKMSDEAKIHFFTLINILNQSGRMHNLNDVIPEYGRVSFYRNIVLEHWDGYTASSPGAGFTLAGNGAIAIPIISSIYAIEERKKLGKELIKFLAKEGQTIDISFDISCLSTSENYCKTIWQVLEAIDLGKINYSFRDKDKKNHFKPLIELLLKLDFPSPITNIDEYLRNFVLNLENLLYSSPTDFPSHS